MAERRAGRRGGIRVHIHALLRLVVDDSNLSGRTYARSLVSEVVTGAIDVRGEV
jgi:hypothetical protein